MPPAGISRSAQIRGSPRPGSLRVVLGPATTDRATAPKSVPLRTRPWRAESAPAPQVRAKLNRIPAEIAATPAPKAKFAGVVTA